MIKRVYFVKIGLDFVGSPSFHIKIYERILLNFLILQYETPQSVLPINPKYDDRLFVDLNVDVFAKVIFHQIFPLLFNG